MQDFVDAFSEAYKAYARESPSLGIQKKNKPRFSLNVVFFTELDSKEDESDNPFKALAGSLNGELRTVDGLDAIKSYVDPSSLED